MLKKIAKLVLVTALVAGCDAVGDPLTAPGTGSAASVSIVLTGSGSDAPAAATLAADPGNAEALPISAVESIRVFVEGVEALPATGGPWEELAVVTGEGMEVELLRMGESEIVLATGDLPAGDYLDARLYIGSATVTLGQDVCLGAADAMTEAQCLAQGDHDAWFPSEAANGIKTDARFTIDDGDVEVELEVDRDATVHSVAWAPAMGKLIIAPVIRAVGAGDDTGSEDTGSEESGAGE